MSLRYKVDALGVEHKIWIPCDAVTEEIDDLINKITADAGGATIMVGVGVWLDSSHTMVEEEVHILSFIGNNLDEGMMDVAHKLLEQGQEAVLISVAGNALLITAEPEEVNKDIKFSWRNNNV
tara:strand:- start:298 stop:666 length:369 start_codon:yes stop_codon:yes gene_type:complete